MLGDYLRGQAPEIEYLVPRCISAPRGHVGRARHLPRKSPADLLVVGSSLGGFYATVAAERTGCRAVVINPAVHPQNHFGRYVGPQRNLYTGERFDLTASTWRSWRRSTRPRSRRPERYWLLAETADEVLDYREAVAYYAGAFQTVGAGR